MWLGLFAFPALSLERRSSCEGEVLVGVELRWSRCGSESVVGLLWTNRLFPESETWAAQLATRREVGVRLCLTVSPETKQPVLFIVLYYLFFFPQMNLVESLLLMRTSSSRSLALMCLYSLYSTANGERSSFCTFLWEQDVGGRQQTLRNREGAAVEKPLCIDSARVT